MEKIFVVDVNSLYQYLLGKVSTRIKNRLKKNKQSEYQYLLGKVSTK